MFFGKKVSKSPEFFYLEPGIYPSNVDNNGAMNTLIEERHNQSEIRITIKVSRRTQKIEIYLTNKISRLAFFSTDLGHNFRGNVGNEFGEMLKRKRPLKPEFNYDIVRIHSLMIYTDLIQYNTVATRRPHCCCVFFLFQSSKLGTL